VRKFSTLLLIALLASCDENLCGNEIIDEVVSPDRKYVASVFERSCGATTPFVRVVSLRTSDTTFDPEDHDNWVFTIRGQPEVSVSWLARDKLRISYSGIGDLPNQRKKWKDVLVYYD